MISSFSIDEYTVEHLPDNLRVWTLDPVDIIYALGRYDNLVYFEGETYTVFSYELDDNDRYIDLHTSNNKGDS